MSVTTLLAWLTAGAWQSGLAGLILLAVAWRIRSHRTRRVLLAGGLVKFLVPTSLTLPFGVLRLAGDPGAASVAWTAVPAAGAASIIIALYAAGALFTLGRLAARSVSLRRERAAATRLEAGPWMGELRTLARRVGLRRVPAVYITSDRAAGPRAFGVLRPTILLPDGLLAGLPRDAVRAVLAHELAHHRPGDLALRTLADLVRVLWWFHPVVWMLAAALGRASEEACDDIVLAARAATRDGYADALLAVARHCAAPRPRVAVVGFARHPLRHRLRRIVLGEAEPRGRLGPALALLLVLALLPGAGRDVAPPDDDVVRIELKLDPGIVPDERARTVRRIVRIPGNAGDRRDR